MLNKNQYITKICSFLKHSQRCPPELHSLHTNFEGLEGARNCAVALHIIPMYLSHSIRLSQSNSPVK